MKYFKRFRMTAAICVLVVLLTSFHWDAFAKENIVLNLNFESGTTEGWISGEDAGKIVQENDGHVFQVGSKDIREDLTEMVNYTVTMRVKIDFADAAFPSIFTRNTEDGCYRIYFDVSSQTIELEKRQGALSVPLGRGNAPLNEFSGMWTDMELSVRNKEISVSFAGEQVLKLEDALPLVKGSIGFSNGGSTFFLDNLTVNALPGKVNVPETEIPGTPQQTEIPGDIIYSCNFENGKGGWESFDNKSKLEDSEGNKVYHVLSYDHDKQTLGWTDFSAEFDIKIGYGQPGTSWPALYLKWSSSGARYDVYFDSASQSICVQYVQGGQKRWIGDGNAPFLANDGKWVHMKAVYREGNIRIYYEDMNVPVVDVTDEMPIIEGGIGFGDGGAQVWVDNIVVRELPVETNLPDFNMEETKNDYDDSDYSAEIRRLIDLGFLTGDENGDIHPYDDLSRAEFAQLLCRARNLQPIAASSFTDVPDNHWANGVIGAVAAAGFMNGYGDGSFRPDELVTANETIKSLVCMIGYGAVAEYEGGWPIGYQVVAARKSISSGISLSGDKMVTRESAIKLLANALETNILIGQIYAGTKTIYEEQSGRNILSEYHNIFKGQGIVTDTDAGSLTGSAVLSRGKVRIDGNVYMEENVQASEYLGRRVNFYYQTDGKDNDTPMLLHLEVRESNQTIQVQAEDIIVSNELNVFRYYDESGKKNQVTLSKNLRILVNENAAEYTAENLYPQVGSVTLINTGEGADYDLAMVERWDSYVIGAISRKDGQIRDYYRDITLDLDTNNANNTYSVIKDGKPAELEDLSIRDVILVAKTDKTGCVNYQIIASSAKLQGTIDAITKENEYLIVETCGTNYKTTAYYQELLDNALMTEVTVGENAVFYFDAKGNIAVIEQKGDSHIVLLNAVANTDGMSGGWKAEILDSNNNWSILEFPSTIKFNGADYSVTEKGMPEELYQNGEVVKQLIYLKKNYKGKILSINTVQPADVDAPLTEGQQYMNGIGYCASNGSFDNRSFIDSNTLVFAIPAEEGEKKKYTAAKQAYFQGDKNYAVKCYNEDEFEVAGAVLVYESKTGATIEKLARPFIVDHITRAWDGEEEVCLLYGYQNGNIVTETLLDQNSANELERGDVVLLKRDFNGKISGISYLIDKSKGRKYSNNPSASLSTDRVVVEGDVIKYSVGEGRLLLHIGEDSAGNPVEKAYVAAGSPTVYYYNIDSDEIQEGSIGDIAPGMHVLLEFSWDSLRDIVLYPEM